MYGLTGILLYLGLVLRNTNVKWLKYFRQQQAYKRLSGPGSRTRSTQMLILCFIWTIQMWHYWLISFEKQIINLKFISHLSTDKLYAVCEQWGQFIQYYKNRMFSANNLHIWKERTWKLISQASSLCLCHSQSNLY